MKENQFKNIIILGELDYVLATHFSGVKSKAKTLEYKSHLLPMAQNENGASNINSLYVLNQMLEKILMTKEENNGILTETCYIAIPKKLYYAYTKGTYKNWLKNDGVAKSGTVFDTKEIDEWARFSSLYADLFQDVILRDASYYEMANPRFDIENMKRHKTLLQQMRFKIEAHKDTTLDIILSCL